MIYNLPTAVKQALKINLLFNYRNIVININKVLREKELSNNVCYSKFFKPQYKTNFFRLFKDLPLFTKLILCI